jgi:sugar phosphate isomerase/epimerase
MKDRIRSTHIHDNDRVQDTHLYPFIAEGGSIDWKDTMEILRSRPGQYPLLLELRERQDTANPLEGIETIFERLENL